jgi:inner membrane protease ATP23
MTNQPPPSQPPLTPHERCEAFARDVLKNVNTVSFLVASIARISGRTIGAADVKCIPSRVLAAPDSDARGLASQHQQQQQQPAATSAQALPQQQAGYMWATTPYARRGSIVLLEDMLVERDDVERALRHELVHAFDDARGQIEPTNCYHQACSEVRAARLSGDCFIREELRRGRVGASSGRDCVMRRAALAVEASPLCRGFGTRAVEVVMPRCYRDFEPFVAPVYVMGNADGLPA